MLSRRPTVLLAVASRATLNRAAAILHAGGFRPLLAGSGPVALRLLADPRRVDLLVVDVDLPGLSGPALALEVRARHPDLRALYVAEGGELDPRVYWQMVSGFARVLSRPVEARRLLAEARELLAAMHQGPGAPVP